MSKPFLNVQHIHKTFTVYPNTINALSGISFQIYKNDFVVIGGANGSGKSLLMSIISGLEKPNSGTVEFGGKKIGLIFQDADSQILGETPREDVAFSAKNRGLTKEEIKTKTDEVLAQVGLIEKADFPARFLSGGEKRRLSVAAMLALDSDLFIFDEPYANLDYNGVQQVNHILNILKKEDKTIIVLTHELEKILAAANRFLVLHNGKLVFDGTPEQGLDLPLETFCIRNPLLTYTKKEDLFWK